MKPFAIHNILAPTDLSESSVPALRYARMFADRFAAKLTVMYTDPVVYPADFMGSTGAFFMTPADEHQARLRDEVQQQAAPILDGSAYDIHVTAGQPVPAILSVAGGRAADLIVMGTHLRHGWRRALLGSVSDGVIHGSRCPVLTIASRDHAGQAAPGAIGKILCPVNFTHVAVDALHVASRLAEAFDAQLTLVHVLETDEVADPGADEERLRRFIAPELQSLCEVRTIVVRGGAAERVLDSAEDLEADLLVVGAQHKLFRDETVIGTTTERLIRFSSCPVLVVPREVTTQRKRMPERELTAAGR